MTPTPAELLVQLIADATDERKRVARDIQARITRLRASAQRLRREL